MKVPFYQCALVTLLLMALSTNTFCQQTQTKDLLTLEAEIQLRPWSMSKNFITAHYALGKLKGDYNQWLNNKGANASTGFGKYGKGALRFVKVGLLDWWISKHFKMLNHELTGHAAYSTASDIFSINEMSLAFNTPIGSFHYLTKPSLLIADADAFVATKVNPGYSVTVNDVALELAAGINASNTLRLNIEEDWFNSKRMHYHQSMMVLQSHIDVFSYCLTSEFGTGTDVNNYLNMVNGNYITFPDSLLAEKNSKLLVEYAEKNFKFTPSDIQRVSYINTLGDPNLYLAVYNIFYKYLLNGDAISTYPMLKIKNINFMPSVGANLSPWGIQYFGQLNMEVKGKRFTGMYHFGKNYTDKFNGISFKAHNLIENDTWRLGAQLDFFKQPKLRTGKKLEAGETYTAITTTGGTGGMISANIDYKLLNSKVPIYLTTTLGYKTAGFIPGQSIAKTPIAALGLSFDITNVNSAN